MSELENVQTFKCVLSYFCFTPLETVQIHKGCCQTQSESADDVRGQSSDDTGIRLWASGTVQYRVKIRPGAFPWR
jgi:hypothetical protein